jgi:predicted Na+-dependent transporter
MIRGDFPATALAWLGRQGTRAVAASLFLALAFPPLAAWCRPIVPEAIFALLVLAFLRVDPRELRGHFAEPTLVLAATLWMMLVVPAGLGLAFVLAGLPDRLPQLYVGLMLQSMAPPIMSAPAFAALMGLESALSLATLIAGFAVTPFSASLFTQLFLGSQTRVSPLGLGLRLSLILAGSALSAELIRRIAGAAWIERQRESIDGLNVVMLFLFAIAVMDGVGIGLLTKPWVILGLTTLAFMLALGLTALTTIVFARVGWGRSLALGLACGHRNLGLMLAATGGSIPDLSWLYFGLAQFPIYLVPHLLQPLARRWGAGSANHGDTRSGSGASSMS